MNYWMNIMLIFIIIGFIILILSILLLRQNKARNKFKSEDEREKYSIPALMDFIKRRMNEITNSNLYAENLSEDEFKRRSRRRQELKEALKSCNTGDLSSKIYVREYIFDLLLNEYGMNEENINWVIPFNNPQQMGAREKFETILHLMIKKHGNRALPYLIETYGLDQPKNDSSPYAIDEADVELMYKDIVKKQGLLFEDKLRVVTQIIYSHYKGFGIVDEIRDQAIDGVMGGVSGSPGRITAYMTDQDILQQAMKNGQRTLNSAWIMYKKKSIHLSFLSFEHESELRRVITNFYKYGSPGQLSESKPAIINEMYDGSRITVFRPKLTESWAFFNRKKYDLEKVELEELYKQKNAELPITLLKFLMKGNRSLAITGAQGSGKTTLLMALVKYIRPFLNLRVQETAHEVNLRSLYPDRNILSFQETDTVSGQAGLDLQKKTDGDVTILGEVATDPVAAWMIQTSQVASLFTLFTHHAKTFAFLVENLRNSLLKTSMFNNEEIAERQVVNALEFDAHLHDSRYIERITECIPVDYREEAETLKHIKNAQTRDEKIDVLIDIATNFFYQKTQRKQYIAQNLVEFRNGEYVAVHPLSKARQKAIEANLTEEERKEFREFIEKYWGQIA